jgi:BrxA
MPANASPRPSAPYTSRIIKAGALIGDTKTLLSHWDLDASVDENLTRVRRENIFGKASRSRVEDILGIFRQRYLSEKTVTRALVTLVRGRFPSAALERVLYFHSARADRLLHDTVTEILLPMHVQGWGNGCSGSMAAAIAATRLALQPVNALLCNNWDHHQSSNRIGPPPSGESVQEQAAQEYGREVRAEVRLA